MARQGLDAQRQHLLRRLQLGQIARPEYDRQIAALEGSGGAPAPLPQGRDTATPQRRDTDARPAPPPRSPQFVSMGDRQTYVPVSSAAGVLHEGMQLGKYEIGKKLGHGGMGEVWKARDTIGDRDVVIKVLLDHYQNNEKEVERIRATFKLVHGLNHTHICPTIDLLNEKGVGLCLVIKFLEAITLDDYRAAFARRHHHFPASEVVRVLMPCAAALDYAHARKVVHRDIKPENIMIRPDGSEPQIIDFGLASELRSSLSSGSQPKRSNDAAGTPLFMAPEQWRSQPVDGKADQYALGVIAYQLLADRFPFVRSSNSDEILRHAVLNDPPPPIASQPDAVNRVLARALAKQPHDRFPTCEAFLQAFAQAAGVAAAGAYRPVPPPRPPGVDAPPPLPPVDPAPSSFDAGLLPPPPKPPSGAPLSGPGSVPAMPHSSPLPPGALPRPPSSPAHASTPSSLHPAVPLRSGSSPLGSLSAHQLAASAPLPALVDKLKSRKKLWIALAIFLGFLALAGISSLFSSSPFNSSPSINFNH